MKNIRFDLSEKSLKTLRAPETDHNKLWFKQMNLYRKYHLNTHISTEAPSGHEGQTANM